MKAFLMAMLLSYLVVPKNDASELCEATLDFQARSGSIQWTPKSVKHQNVVFFVDVESSILAVLYIVETHQSEKLFQHVRTLENTLQSG